MKQSVKLAALCGITTVALVGAGCSSQSSSSSDAKASGNAATGGGYGLSAVANPDSGGKELLNLIGSAKKSIDIVIYQIGGPDVQDPTKVDPTLPNALVAAMKNGVTVRTVMDGANTKNTGINKPFADAVKTAAATAGVPANLFQPHWSSSNFNFTHQKTVIVDAVDATGKTLPVGSMPESAQLMISTGNFANNPSPLQPWYAARDFEVVTASQDLLSQASTVFNSDFACDGRTVTNNLKDSSKLVWSNGTTQLYTSDPVGAYPSAADGYFDSAKEPYNKTSVDQGNAFTSQMNLLTNAKEGDVVRIYNEEFADTFITDAITKAATPVAKGGQGADVRIVMSYGAYKGVPDSFVATLEAVAAAGGRVTLMAPQDAPGFENALYIHAKMITVTPKSGTPTGFVGSENFSGGSLGFNRELGILLDSNDQSVLDTLNSTFDTDFNRTDMATQLTPANPKNIPASWNATAPGLGSPPPAQKRLGAPAGTCGPLYAS